MEPILSERCVMVECIVYTGGPPQIRGLCSPRGVCGRLNECGGRIQFLSTFLLTFGFQAPYLDFHVLQNPEAIPGLSPLEFKHVREYICAKKKGLQVEVRVETEEDPDHCPLIAPRKLIYSSSSSSPDTSAFSCPALAMSCARSCSSVSETAFGWWE